MRDPEPLRSSAGVTGRAPGLRVGQSPRSPTGAAAQEPPRSKASYRMQDPRMDLPGAAPYARVSAARADDERRKTLDESRGSMSTGRWMWEWTKAISTAILL